MVRNEDWNPQQQTNQFAKRCIAEALIRMLEDKKIEEINVSDICREAGFSRMAYYRNFTSKQDILSKYMFMFVDDFRKDSLEHFPNQAPHSYELILYGFTYFRNYRVFAKRLIEANMSSILQDGINYYFETYLAGDSPSPERPYEMQYYAGALYNLYTRWIQNGVKESPEFMARIVYNIVNSR